MPPTLVRSIGGYEGSPVAHPQRHLDASLRVLGYEVESLELPDNTAPAYPACLAFLQAQCQGLADGVLILHSLASRVFLLLVAERLQHGPLTAPLVDTAVLLAPANGRYIADWVPAVAPFFSQDIWTPNLSGAARRLLIAAADDDVYWEEATADLEVFRQQPGVEVLLLVGQGHLNDTTLAEALPAVRDWLVTARPA